MSKQCFVKVCILTSASFEDKLFTYEVPDNMCDEIKRGSVITVPFGIRNRAEIAVVLEKCETCDIKDAKSINGFFDRDLFISENLLSLCDFIKENCFCSLASALKTVLPPCAKLKRTKSFCAVEQADQSLALTSVQSDVLDFIKSKDSVSEQSIKQSFPGCDTQKILAFLQKQSLIEVLDTTKDKASVKTEKYVCLNSLVDLQNLPALSASAHRVISFLKDGQSVKIKELVQIIGCSESVVKTLHNKNLVSVITKKVQSDIFDFENIKAESKDFDLSCEQSAVYGVIESLLCSQSPKCALLYGVTGSGKTNVMLKTIDKALSMGKGVIVLVPEISLTAQTVSIFAGRYGKDISVIHSALTNVRRTESYYKISSGASNIVIGTRSAVFAPVKNLGLIVIDEEQENSFKSDMTPKYHARDIARFRCAKENALLLLCSATPSIESMYKAKSGVYTLVTMKNRYGTARLPQVKICDMRAEPRYIESNEPDTKGGVVQNVLGKELLCAVEENLRAGQQTILLMNRRGYHSFSLCYKCGNVVRCPHCSVSLTYHKHEKGRLVCHYCGYSVQPKQFCEVCNSEYMGFMGSGTQLVEQSLKTLFPNARILRMDADTVSQSSSHEKILGQFRQKKADILVGTQMVAKGHDFPEVSLVGVINADNSLFLDDYRANERTFALLTQVIGRAGRAKIEGKAIVQTYNPENDIIRLSAAQDYDKFYEGEIKLRQSAVFPPFCDIITVRLICDSEIKAKNLAEKLGLELDLLCKTKYKDVKLALYGPFEDTVFKVAEKYRMKYVIKCRNSKATRQLFGELSSVVFAKYKSVGAVSIDMNPTIV